MAGAAARAGEERLTGLGPRSGCTSAAGAAQTAAPAYGKALRTANGGVPPIEVVVHAACRVRSRRDGWGAIGPPTAAAPTALAPVAAAPTTRRRQPASRPRLRSPGQAARYSPGHIRNHWDSRSRSQSRAHSTFVPAEQRPAAEPLPGRQQASPRGNRRSTLSIKSREYALHGGTSCGVPKNASNGPGVPGRGLPLHQGQEERQGQMSYNRMRSLALNSTPGFAPVVRFYLPDGSGGRPLAARLRAAKRAAKWATQGRRLPVAEARLRHCRRSAAAASLVGATIRSA